eukprot:CAMPEP_0205936164 /NCGR_PEP_ID=MMETSP1325-20131115/40896_1 /ASSEMBLY_ACC=CAM_ASM_000708 /TAXON_ID=236786 /ORGANISM="Florenciella sp., Strain RCC1007" /LENGTH=41 /DNA_ID= /DNA_START= /DNA_END= /DNA_ORIENTATION=
MTGSVATAASQRPAMLWAACERGVPGATARAARSISRPKLT